MDDKGSSKTNKYRIKTKPFYEKVLKKPNNENVKNTHKEIKTELKKAKKDYYDIKFAEHINNAGKTWGTITQILGKQKSINQSPKELVVNNRKIIDNKQKANSFNEFFTGLAEGLINKLHAQETDMEVVPPLSSPQLPKPSKLPELTYQNFVIELGK